MPIGSDEMAQRFPGFYTAGSGGAPFGPPAPGGGNPFGLGNRTAAQGIGDFLLGFAGQPQLALANQKQRRESGSVATIMELMEQAQATGKNPIELFKTMSPEQKSALLEDPNWAQNFEAAQKMLQSGQKDPLVTKPGDIIRDPKDPTQIIAQNPAAPGDQPASVQEMIALGFDPKTPEGQAGYAAWKRSQSHGPQAPELPADIRTLQFIADQQGWDLQKPEEMLKAIDMAGRLGSSTVNQFSYPTGYAPTGETDAQGRPVVSPLKGTPDAAEAEGAAQTKQKAAQALDTVIKAIELNPGEFGAMAGIKESARAAASTVEQLGKAAGGVMPGASIASKAAGALRQGPLGEPEKGLTRDQTQAVLDRLALDIARTGLSEGDQRAAQQEINNVREAMQAGGLDIPTVIRRLTTLKDTLFGEGVPPADAAGARAEDIQEETPPAAATPLAVVTSREDYDALPAGAEYTLQDGSKWRKGR